MLGERLERANLHRPERDGRQIAGVRRGEETLPPLRGLVQAAASGGLGESTARQRGPGAGGVFVGGAGEVAGVEESGGVKAAKIGISVGLVREGDLDESAVAPSLAGMRRASA